MASTLRFMKRILFIRVAPLSGKRCYLTRSLDGCFREAMLLLGSLFCGCRDGISGRVSSRRKKFATLPFFCFYEQQLVFSFIY